MIKTPTTPHHFNRNSTKLTHRKTVLAGLLCLAIQTYAHAEDKNWYATVLGGSSMPSDTDYLSNIDGDSLNFDTEFGNGVLFGGNLGYEFNQNWSGEFEYIWQRSDSDRFQLAALPPGGEGDVASVTIMFNALRNWDLSQDGGWQFFAGGGLGWVQEVSSDYELDGTEYSFDGDGFGFQGFIGIRKDLGDKWFWSAKLNQLWGGSYSLTREDDREDRIEMDYDVTSLQIGLGFRF